MPGPTAIDIFDKTLSRARRLLSVSGLVSDVEEETQADMLRAAVVLAVAALDGYVTQVMHEGVQDLLADPNKEIPDELVKRLVDRLSHKELVYVGRFKSYEPILTKVFRDFVSQGPARIEESMRYLGHKDVLKTIARNQNVSESNFQHDVDEVTKRRHDIVHRGDYTKTAPREEQTIDKSFVEDSLTTIEMVAHGIQGLL